MKYILIILILFSLPSFGQGHKYYHKGGVDTTINASLFADDTLVLNNKNGYLGNIVFNYSAAMFKGSLYSRLQFNGCWYIKITGKQRPGLDYGIYMEHFPGAMNQWGGADYFPMQIAQKSKCFEIEGYWGNKVSTGVVIKEDPYCLDSLNFGNGFTMDSMIIHDNKITRVFNEGMYLGNTLPDNNPEGYIYNDTKRPWVCTNIFIGGVRFHASDSTIRFQGDHTSQMPPGMYFRVGGASVGHNNDYNQSWVVKSYTGASTYVGDTTILHVRNIDLTHAGVWMSDEKVSIGSVDSVKFNRPMRLGYLKIYNNVTDSTGRGGIQISSSNSSRCEIYSNTCKHAGLTRVGGQGNGITWGKYTNVNCYNNTVVCTVAEGIHITGGGFTGTPQIVYNNYIDSSGYCNAYVDPYGGNFAIYDIINDPGNNWVSAIAFRTRGCDSLPALDSTMFWIKNNRVGIFTLSRQTTWDGKTYGGLLIEDYNQSTQRSGNAICSNTALDGVTPIIDNVNKIVQLQYDAGAGQIAPVWDSTACPFSTTPTYRWHKPANSRVIIQHR